MKRLFSTILMLMCLFSTIQAHALEPPHLEQLTVETAMAPPHNEPVVGNRVARYRAELKGDVRWGRLQWEPKITAWGVNAWRSTDAIGHGWDAWRNSDYSIEKIRVSHTQNLSLWLSDHVALTTEYYMPLNRKSWGGHGLERHYYWLVGFRWQLF